MKIKSFMQLFICQFNILKGKNIEYKIQKIKAYQQKQLSKILVEVYFKAYTKEINYFPSSLRNKYLLKLRDLKKYIKKTCCNIYVATNNKNQVLGGVFYCSDLKEYGLELKSNLNKTCAIRYLAVDEKYRGYGIAKSLVKACIAHAKKDKNKKIVLHTMESMKEASKIYTQYEFKRHKDIDFRKNGINVRGYTKNIL